MWFFFQDWFRVRQVARVRDEPDGGDDDGDVPECGRVLAAEGGAGVGRRVGSGGVGRAVRQEAP